MKPCPGPNRRRVLQVGAAALGLSLTRLLRAEAAPAAALPKARARSVVILYLSGGPSQLDMWDMKPDAPADLRGTFQPIRTSVSGIEVCEHLPRMAKLAHLYTIVRSMSHREEDHLKAGYYVMTGAPLPRAIAQRSGMERNDRPHAGAIISRALGSGQVPGFCMIPEFISPVGPARPGQHAGFLGAEYDPYLIDSDPNEPGYDPGPVGVAEGSRATRALRLRALLEAAERGGPLRGELPAVREYQTYREKALDLVSSPAAQQAFDVSREPEAVRDRYGRHHFGQSALVARRLVEAGARVVQVNFIRHDFGKGGQGYDSHSALGFPPHLPWLKDELAPPTDAAFAALVEDLHDRGLLDETLLVMMGEFGRTPKFNKDGGRDHWAKCYSLVMAGGGVPRGQVYGASDATASEPTENPVSPEDLLATVYHLLGVDHRALIHDLEDRPHPTVEGEPVRGLIA
ncbi:MAG: DUF1501 domain-containing protein [Armatimonadota bacterium]